MKTYHFTLYLKEADVSEDLCDTLYGIQQDGSLVSSCGKSFIHFHRDASNLEKAIVSAKRDVESVGLHVTKLEMDFVEQEEKV